MYDLDRIYLEIFNFLTIAQRTTKEILFVSCIDMNRRSIPDLIYYVTYMHHIAYVYSSLVNIVEEIFSSFIILFYNIENKQPVYYNSTRGYIKNRIKKFFLYKVLMFIFPSFIKNLQHNIAQEHNEPAHMVHRST